MSRTRKMMISDYTEHLEWLTLAGEDLTEVEAVLEAVGALIEKDPLSPAAERLVSFAKRAIKERASCYFTLADEQAATIEQLQADQEAESCQE